MKASLFDTHIDSPAWHGRGASMFEVIDHHEFIRTAFVTERAAAISQPPGFAKRGCYVWLDLAAVADYRLVASALLRQLHEALQPSHTAPESVARHWQRLQWRWWIEELCRSSERAQLAEYNGSNRNTEPPPCLRKLGIHVRQLEVHELSRAEKPTDKAAAISPDTTGKELFQLIRELFSEKPFLKENGAPHESSRKFIELSSPAIQPELCEAVNHALRQGEGSVDIVNALVRPSASPETRPNFVLCIHGFSEIPNQARPSVLEELKRLAPAIGATAVLLVVRHRIINRGEFPPVHLTRLPDSTPWVALPLFLLAAETMDVPRTAQAVQAQWHPVLQALAGDIDALRIISSAAQGSLLAMFKMSQRVLDVSDELNPPQECVMSEQQSDIVLSLQVGDTRPVKLLIRQKTKPTKEEFAKKITELQGIAEACQTGIRIDDSDHDPKQKLELFRELQIKLGALIEDMATKQPDASIATTEGLK